ncbi:MAG: alpha/beta hydrolase [Pseudomonadota bacterium]
MAVMETEFVYQRRGELALQAVYYGELPISRSTRPMLIDVHGGAWSSGHRKSGKHYDTALAAAGFDVLAIDFRQGPDFKHPAAIEDIRAAVRWTRQQFEPGNRPLGLVGSSSGGHLALCAALDPDGGEPAETTAAVDFVIALWPVSNPIARYQYATSRLAETEAQIKGFTPDRLVSGHDAYFVDQQQMSDAAVQNILLGKKHTHLPPVMIVQPELDQNVPVMMSQTLAGALNLAGGEVSYHLYPGVGHGFAHQPGDQTDRCIADMITFIQQNAQTRLA